MTMVTNYLSKDDFISAYALSQRERPNGIGWRQSYNIKKQCYKKHGLEAEVFLYDAPDSVCAEILKQLREEWKRCTTQ